MGIVSKLGDKAKNKVAKWASLGSKELEEIEIKRQEFLHEMPKPDDPSAIELTERFLATASIEIYSAFLPQIKDLYLPIKLEDGSNKEFEANYNIRYFDVTKWVTDKKENSIEKLVNVYEVLSNERCNIALIFNRTKNTTNVYLAVSNAENKDDNAQSDNYSVRLSEAVKGNFPGSTISEAKKGYIPCIENDGQYSVATVSNLSSEKSEKYISQTIEKLLDGIVPDANRKEYTIVLMATPILDNAERKIHLGELYSALVPYAQWSTSYTVSEQDTVGSSASINFNVGASAGQQQGTNSSSSVGDGWQDSNSEANQTTPDSASDNTSAAVGNIVTKTLGNAVSRSVSVVDGLFKATNFGVNMGAGFARSSNVSVSLGKSEAINQSFGNYNIKHTLELLEEQMKRYEESNALGMWDFAAYIMSEDVNVVNNVAHSYLSLTQGEKSYLSNAAINIWNGRSVDEEAYTSKLICDYIRQIKHPIFALNPYIVREEPDFIEYPPMVNATVPLSGKELAYSLNFPSKSVPGLPVLQCVEFGRNIASYDMFEQGDEKVHLGKIFNMNRVEPVSVDLDMESLSAHTFITGSTGSGKSNTVYQIIKEALNNDKKFMVVEPAKGEYKDVFGNRDDVNVYGTNQYCSELLRINPFSFPKGIHVFEHLDRLVEIFNVCWPMYAAMPAVLKNAIQKSYEDCGWNMSDSTNQYGEKLYPSFGDVARNISTLIDSSEYDADNKGAYKGSLLTRLESLTNGINGMIFVSDEIPYEDLFDNNAIIDLSRVGSTETKSLIMGILVLKLQEYRMSTNTIINSKINHLTILEEAHNILRRSTVAMTADGGDLTGKSVEMIGNAIAEMRTYGEGFVIVDQSPGLLDMSSIRNTNTKIIMRLPDKTDRELVGYAAGLNDDQIKELTRLPKGVGAIYQNDWIQPILCKIDKAIDEIDRYKYVYVNDDNYTNSIDTKINIASWLSNGTSIDDVHILNEIRDDLMSLAIESSIIVRTLKLLEMPAKEPRMTQIGPIMAELFPAVKKAVEISYNDTSDKIEWTNSALSALEQEVGTLHSVQLQRDIIQSIITYHILVEENNLAALREWSEEGGFN